MNKFKNVSIWIAAFEKCNRLYEGLKKIGGFEFEFEGPLSISVRISENVYIKNVYIGENGCK